MAFNFIVEDGSGDSDANSYCETYYADDYISTNAYASAEWLANDLTVKQALLIRASKYLDSMFEWKGRRAHRDSGLKWPRYECYDCDGFEMDHERLPRELKDATCEMATYLMSSDWTNLESSRGIREVKADVVDVKFDTSQTRGSVPYAVIAILQGLGNANTGKRPSFKPIVRC